MLDHLVESKNHTGENRRRGGFLLTTFTAVFSVLALVLLYSLFSYNLAMANERLDISSLVAPVAPPDTAPPVVEEVREPKASAPDSSIDKLPSRRENMQSTGETPIKTPDGISTQKNPNLSRPTTAFTISTVDAPGSFSGSSPTGRPGAGDGNQVGLKPSTEEPKIVEDTPPPVIKKPEPKPAPTTIRTSQILNGEAKLLVKPVYTQAARIARAQGTVNVQVTIDENGNVVSANAVGGHPLLRQVSETAARASKFSSTVLNGQKVKVTGVIVYNFTLQ